MQAEQVTTFAEMKGSGSRCDHGIRDFVEVDSIEARRKAFVQPLPFGDRGATPRLELQQVHTRVAMKASRPTGPSPEESRKEREKSS
jgi:hypothetical protein